MIIRQMSANENVFDDEMEDFHAPVTVHKISNMMRIAWVAAQLARSHTLAWVFVFGGFTFSAGLYPFPPNALVSTDMQTR